MFELGAVILSYIKKGQEDNSLSNSHIEIVFQEAIKHLQEARDILTLEPKGNPEISLVHRIYEMLHQTEDNLRQYG